ncbi:MAG: nuclear transport factor 2 family protein [Pseudomonadota bacterium]
MLTYKVIRMLDANQFARVWEAGWNSHDLDRIMAHYRDDVVFRSLKALATVGEGELHGARALRAYWTKALERQPDLRFEVLDTFKGHAMNVLLYENQIGTRATETLFFDAEGRVFQAADCHQMTKAT